MVREARLEPTGHGLVPRSDGWFVVNAREAPWRHAEGRRPRARSKVDPEFAQLGIHLSSLEPGVPLSMYHGAGVAEETTDEKVVYAHVPWRESSRFREGWFPGDAG